MTSDQHPYASLSPELVIDAIESTGLLSDLRVLALNSYENRVYQIGIEEGEPIIAKFYRPGRWSDAQILEEHSFSQELAEAEIPVVAPLANDQGETLRSYGGFRFALYPRRGGHAPEIDNPDHLLMLGRLVGRMHAIGSQRPFEHRPRLSLQNFGTDSYEFVRDHFIPMELRTPYASLCEDLLARVASILEQHPAASIRTHSDFHVGNILCRGEHFHLVDLDDCRMTPAVQDLWMFLSGDRNQRMAQLSELVDGYDEFFEFDPRELQLVESLRTLRLMHYAAWLARRWSDPAFPMAFPWFNTQRYWSDHILELREQLAALDEEPLKLF